MSWQVLISISVITFSVSVLLRRLLLHKDKSDPIAYSVVFQTLAGLMTLGYCFFFHGIYWPDFSQLWFPILTTIIFFAAAHTVSAKAFQHVEASVFSILYATSTIWIMIAGIILFGDSLTLQQLIGVVLIFLSIGVLVDKKSLFKLNKGLLYGLATGMLFGLATAGWVYVARYADTPTWNALSFIGAAPVVLLYKPKTIFKLKEYLNRTLLIRIIILAFVYSIASLTMLLAFANGNMSVVAALQQTNIIVTTILGIIFLKEKDNFWKKCLAAVVCFIAVLLII